MKSDDWTNPLIEWKKAADKIRGKCELVSIGQLLDIPNRSPRTGDRWGPWRYSKRWRALDHITEGYQVDLERISNAREVLEWILHISHKSWAKPADIGHLVLALRDLGYVEEGEI